MYTFIYAYVCACVFMYIYIHVSGWGEHVVAPALASVPVSVHGVRARAGGRCVARDTVIFALLFHHPVIRVLLG